MNSVLNNETSIYNQTQQERIYRLDQKAIRAKKEKRRREKIQKENEMQKIFENTPYAFEACRFDRIINPDRWFKP